MLASKRGLVSSRCRNTARSAVTRKASPQPISRFKEFDGYHLCSKPVAFQVMERRVEKLLPPAVESGAHLEADRGMDRFLASCLKIFPDSQARPLSGPGRCTSKHIHDRERSACVRTRSILAEAA